METLGRFDQGSDVFLIREIESVLASAHVGEDWSLEGSVFESEFLIDDDEPDSYRGLGFI